MGRICAKSKNGVKTFKTRSDNPAQIPNGIPIERERITAANVIASVSMLSVHIPNKPQPNKSETAKIVVFKLLVKKTKKATTPMTPSQPKTGIIELGAGIAINILINSTNPLITVLMGLKK